MAGKLLSSVMKDYETPVSDDTSVVKLRETLESEVEQNYGPESENFTFLCN